MTREKAIKHIRFVLSALDENSQIAEAYRMAIKALEQEPNCPFYKIDEDGHGLCKNHRVLEQEPCDDAVSRQKVLDLLENTNNGWVINEVLQLPPVNPQEPKMGHWIEYPHNSGIVVCNQCKGIRRDCRVGYTNYCNKCGAKMIESQESEDKE